MGPPTKAVRSLTDPDIDCHCGFLAAAVTKAWTLNATDMVDDDILDSDDILDADDLKKPDPSTLRGDDDDDYGKEVFKLPQL